MAPAPKPHHADIAIAGGGPVGLTLALALARKGFEVVVVDAAAALKPAKPAGDSRAFFIGYGAWRIFRALGLEEALLAKAQKVRQVEAKGRIGAISFLAEDSPEPVLGYMIEAADLSPVLHEAANAQKGLKLIAPAQIEAATFGDPEAALQLGKGEVRSALVIGCDGRNSAVRRAAGLRFEGWDYDAKAISTTVKLGAPHEGAARQIFLPGGPLAVLPLCGDRANLIWTEKSAVADALIALDDRRF